MCFDIILCFSNFYVKFYFADSQGGSQYVVHHQQRVGVAYGQQAVQQAAYDSRSVLSYLFFQVSIHFCSIYV